MEYGAREAGEPDQAVEVLARIVGCTVGRTAKDRGTGAPVEDVTNPTSEYWSEVLGTLVTLLSLAGYQVPQDSDSLKAAVELAVRQGFLRESNGMLYPGQRPPGEGENPLGHLAPLLGGGPLDTLSVARPLPEDGGFPEGGDPHTLPHEPG